MLGTSFVCGYISSGNTAFTHHPILAEKSQLGKGFLRFFYKTIFCKTIFARIPKSILRFLQKEGRSWLTKAPQADILKQKTPPRAKEGLLMKA